LWELLTLLYCCWKLYNDDVDEGGAYAGSGAAIRSINESLTALNLRSTFNFWKLWKTHFFVSQTCFHLTL